MIKIKIKTNLKSGTYIVQKYFGIVTPIFFSYTSIPFPFQTVIRSKNNWYLALLWEGMT